MSYLVILKILSQFHHYDLVMYSYIYVYIYIYIYSLLEIILYFKCNVTTIVCWIHECHTKGNLGIREKLLHIFFLSNQFFKIFKKHEVSNYFDSYLRPYNIKFFTIHYFSWNHEYCLLYHQSKYYKNGNAKYTILL